MKYFKNSRLLHFLFAVVLTTTTLIFYSCRKEQAKEIISIDSPNSNIFQTGIGSEDCMEFAPQTPNPYTLPNMTAALTTLKSANEFECDYTKFNIRVTHQYIKFKPQDTAQLEKLKDDTTLILFDYPMDRKLIKAGVYYRDPILTENELNFVWCCIPVGQLLPSDVPFELLSDLYIPELDPNLEEFYNTEFDGCINLLIDEAMKRTGNFDTTSYDTIVTSPVSKITLRSPPKWSPKGTIKRFDNRLNVLVPLEGVKVRAHRWFETRECLTNVDGFYNIGSEFRYPVDYSIKWERQDFDIMDNYIGQAYFNGPHQKGDWNLDISDGKSRFYAHIHRACIDYFYRSNLFNLTPPPKNSFWTSRLSIAARNINDGSGAQGVAHPWTRPLGAWPQIYLRRPGRRSDFVYATTIHELAHYAHWGMNKSKYNNCDGKISESWAEGVEWVFASWRYGSYGDPDDQAMTTGGTDNYQNRPISGPEYQFDPDFFDEYTPVVVDLIDDNNQRATPADHASNPTFWPDDRVSGYTIRQIEISMIKSLTWADWETNMRNDHTNATEDFLDELF